MGALLMSITSLGIIGGLAGTQLPQRVADSDKVQQGQGEQSRAADAAQKAEAPPKKTPRLPIATPTAAGCGSNRKSLRKHPHPLLRLTRIPNPDPRIRAAPAAANLI
jgi:hypothetical protein